VTDREALVERVAQLASQQELRVVTSESLTSGALASSLGAGPDAASWFGGGVVAYQEPVKFQLLDVPEGPVVTAECAQQMAIGTRALFRADIAVSATGVGGPEPSEGKDPGTVFMAAATADGVTTRELELDGDPEAVLAQTIDHGLELLVEILEGQPTRSSR
jgi:nicotinamide-nucleotide amidase